MIEASDRQPVLDELAGALQKGKVHRPIKYLEALVKKAAEKTFIPEMAVAVAKKRKEAEAASARLETLRLEAVESSVDIREVMDKMDDGPLKDSLIRIGNKFFNLTV